MSVIQFLMERPDILFWVAFSMGCIGLIMLVISRAFDDA